MHAMKRHAMQNNAPKTNQEYANTIPRLYVTSSCFHYTDFILKLIISIYKSVHDRLRE